MKQNNKQRRFKHTCPTSTLCWYFRAIAPEFVKMAVPLPYGFLFTMSMALNQEKENPVNLVCHYCTSRRNGFEMQTKRNTYQMGTSFYVTRRTGVTKERTNETTNERGCKRMNERITLWRHFF